MTELFVATSYVIALAIATDRHHERAAEIARDIKAKHLHMVTTRTVLVEIGDALSKLRLRQAAISLLDSIGRDPRITILPLSEDLYGRAFTLFRSRADKEWGLTDCVSFVAMQERGIAEALTADDHFRQAGFRARLLEP
jgi:predicted nucleic acid-binding protein